MSKYRWNSPYEWLEYKMDNEEWSEANIRAFFKYLASKVDSDTLQDIFESNMEDDGYFQPFPLPKYRILLLDETNDWSEEVVELAGHIFGVYVYNAEEQTHCCELTPSYALHFLDYVAEKYPEDEETSEKLHDWLEEGKSATELVSYMHCHSIDVLPQINRGEIRAGTYESDHEIDSDDSDDPIEQIREQWSANPHY